MRNEVRFFCFGKVRRRHERTHAGLFGAGAKNVLQFPPREGIDPDRRFVEEKEFGRGEKACGEPQFLLHPARKGAGAAILEARESRERKELRKARAGLVLRDAPQLGKNFEVFKDREFLIEPEFLRHEARAARKGRVRGRETEHAHVARVGREKPDEKPQKGRLSGAVGTRDRNETGLLGKFEREFVHRRERPSVGADKAFYEFFDAEDAHSGLSFTVTG